MIEDLSTTKFKSGWTRMERVLFLMTLLLTICVLILCSGILLILLGDIKLPWIRSTPPSATTKVTLTVKPTVAMTTNPTKPENQTSGTMSFTTREKITPTSVTPERTTSSPEMSKVCETRGCVVAAARVLQSMNRTVKPCDDFYQYACGSWIKSHPVKQQEADSVFMTEIKANTLRFTALLSNFEPGDIEAAVNTKQAYASCVQEGMISINSRENVDYLIKTAGGMPLADLNWTMDQSLEDFLIGLRRNFAVMPLLPVTVKTDEKNTSRYRIHIGSGEQVSSDDIISPKLYRSRLEDPVYDQVVTQIIEQFNIPRERIDNQVKEVDTFQQAFRTIKWETRVNMDNLLEIYNPITLGELQAKYTTFDWKHFLEGLLSNNVTKITLPEDETLIMASPSYIARLMTMMNETRNRTIVNYAILSTIMHYKDPLGMNSRTLYSAKKEKKKDSHYNMVRDRTNDCADVFVENCPHVMGWMYIHKYFNEDQANAIKMLTQMTNSMKKAVETVLETTPWLGPKSKKYGLLKIKDLLEIIGYNKKAMTAQNVNRFFNGLIISPWNYFQNIMQIKARHMELQLSKFGKPTSRIGTDGDEMFVVNAWYEPQVNMITIPAGIIRNPFFDIQSPMALNFGSLGTVVGHELMHAYDDAGSLYDSKGNYFPWLSVDDKKEFIRLSQGLVKQYSSFKIPIINSYINGTLTLGENIADNGAIKVTYMAYISWADMSRQSDYRLPGLNLNPDQLFFLSFAQTWCSNYSPAAYQSQILYDPHATDEARVLLTLRNTKEFSSAYGCPQGSKMNPAKKYGVW